jgi:hypothetical protein
MYRSARVRAQCPVAGFITFAALLLSGCGLDDSADEQARGEVFQAIEEGLTREVVLADFTDFAWDTVVVFQRIPDEEVLSREYGTTLSNFAFTTWEDGLLLFCLDHDAVVDVVVNTESLSFTDRAVFGNDLVIDRGAFSHGAEVSDHTCT